MDHDKIDRKICGSCKNVFKLHRGGMEIAISCPVFEKHCPYALELLMLKEKRDAEQRHL